MKHQHPPKLFLDFFRWFCNPEMRNHIEGDLLELYSENLRTTTPMRARLGFIRDVLLLFRPGIIKNNLFVVQLTERFMIRNYATTALRNIMKNKSFSVINVAGLAIGLASCILILEFVTFELSYDQFHQKVDRTYRVTNDRFQNGKLIQHGTITYPTIGPVMAKDFPEIETYTRLMPSGELNVKINDRNYRGDACHFADEYFFSVFDFAFLAGERSTSLKEPYSAVLTEAVAIKYYESNDPKDALGKVFYWGLDPQPYTVKGVIANVPENSHLQFAVLVSYSTLYAGEDKGADNSWTWSDMRHYLVLRPGANPNNLIAKFDNFSERYFKGDEVTGSIEKFSLQPLRDAHLYSDYEYDFAKTANGKFVWSMLVVAVIILAIAWINYVNLTTSKSLDRAKEVGLRKVMGAYRVQLVRQFVFESLVITSLAILLAIGLVYLFQEPFNKIIGSNLSLKTFLQYLSNDALIFSVVILLAGAVVAGFYPAFVLSAFQPATTLKGKFVRSGRGNYIRKSLVVVQFSASVALVAGTLIVSKQLKFMNDADLGINVNNTVIVQGPELMAWDSTFISRVETFKQELSNINGVTGATTSTRTPGRRLGRAFGVRLADHPADAHYTFSHMGIDHNFFDTYKISTVAGRKFLPTDHKENFQDINTIIINESAGLLLGLKNADEAIGKEIVWGNNGTRKWTIVGVIKDFHQESLHRPKEAMLFRPLYSTFSPTSIRIEPEKTTQALVEIEKVYEKTFPGNSFQYYFLSDYYRDQYKDDHRFGRIVEIFTVLAIIISCLGLIGLTMYTASQRTKEIGVRKVLGASVPSILLTLSTDLLRPVVLSILIATPIAWWVMMGWLEEFVYRTSFGAGVFLLSGIGVASIAMITIALLTLNAARNNPIKNLRVE